MMSILFVSSCSWQAGIVHEDGSKEYYASKKAKNTMLKNDSSVKVSKLDNGISYYIKETS